MNARDLLIGIDIGSTNVRAAVYDTAGRLVTLASCSTEETWRGDDALPQAVITLCDEALGRIDGVFKLHGIAVGCVGCGAVAVGHNGEQVHLKGDGQVLATDFFTHFNERDVFNITGYPPNEGNIAFRIAAHEKKPNAPKVAHVFSIADYVVYRLTGEVSREYSTACSMGVWDNQNGGWWRRLFDAAGVDETVFGTVQNSGCETGTILRRITETTRIPHGTRVFTGGHDYLCAAFAVGGMDNRSIINVTGTYEIMASFHDTPWQRDISNTDPIRPLVDNHVLPGKFSYQLESFGAGQTEWLRKNIFNADTETWNHLFKQLEARNTRGDFSAPAAELYIPHLQGQIVPAVDMDAMGVFVGLTETTDRVTLLKSAIEGLCFKSREMLDAQRKVTTKHPAVKMVGGGSKSCVWVQAKADILNTPVFVPRIQEATALGAAMLAGVGAGVYASYGDAMRTIEKLGTEVFEPRAEFAALYEDIFYNKYLRIIKFLTSITK